MSHFWQRLILLVSAVSIVSIIFSKLPSAPRAVPHYYDFTKAGPSRFILLWTAFFGEKDFIQPLQGTNCSQTSCIFTSDRKYYLLADAVIFHFRDVAINDLPDESLRPPHQRWVMLLAESPEFTPKDVVHALDGKINWTITYRQSSDIDITPKVVPIPVEEQSTAVSYVHHVLNKNRQVAWFVSHCPAPSRRDEYVKELSKYIKVDIYGSCGSHQCHPKMSPKCYEQVAQDYFFYLSFENSLCRDYVTEKLFNVLHYPIVPIVMNSANMSIVAPPNSYISIHDFKSPAKLASYLVDLVANRYTKYIKFFEARSKYRLHTISYPCRLCEMIHNKTVLAQTKVYSNLYAWWFEEAACTSWQLR